jgi:hypothetical protein
MTAFEAVSSGLDHALVVALTCAFLSACGGSPPFPEASHPPLPQITNLGGPVLNEPTVISVTYPGDSLQETLEAFTAQMTASAYWNAVAEYGVQSAHAGTAIHMGDTAPASIDDAQIQNDFPLQLAANQFGTVPNGAIYVFYLPDGVTVTNHGQQSCRDFGGYHSSVALSNGSFVAYAVIPRCPNLFKLSAQDATTATASHEILEAATDPYFENQHGAWGALDPADIGWSVFPGTEIADLCLIANDSFFTPPDLAYVVQRVWSNQAAANGANPCVPTDPTTPYFNSVPVLPDVVQINLGGGNFAAKGLSIPVGSQKTVELDLFSTWATDPWTLSAQSLTGATPVQVSFDRVSGANGDKIQMTVLVPQAGNYLGMQNVEPFAIVSTLGSVSEAWPVLVVNPQ